MTLYVIRANGNTLRYIHWTASPSQVPYWTRSLSDAKKFDSVTTAELFATQVGLTSSYRVIPIESTSRLGAP